MIYLSYFKLHCTVCLMRITKEVNEIIVNPIAFRKAKILYNFGLSECNRANELLQYDTL